MIRAFLTTLFCLAGPPVFAAPTDNTLHLLFFTVVIICIILQLITMLLYFMAKTSDSLWIVICLALAGMAALGTSPFMLHQCVMENSQNNNGGFVICYIATGATMVGGFWAINYARIRQRKIQLGRTHT
jgi:hypothetical protein